MTRELTRTLALYSTNRTSNETSDSNESSEERSSNSDETQRSRKRRHVRFGEFFASMMISGDDVGREGGMKIREMHELIHLAIPEEELPDQSRLGIQ